MEELLASIRSIISDADKKSPLSREAGLIRPALAPAAHDALAGDEVLDLTEELVFPEDNAAVLAPEAAKPAMAHAAALPKTGNGRGDPQAPANRDLPASQAPAHPRAGDAQPRQEQTKGPLQRPVWSRREISFPGAPFEPAAQRPRQEAAQSKPAVRNWPGDIQMAVPEQGPVSLVPPAEPERARAGLAPELANDEAGAAAGGLDAGEEAAVAVLAKKLARSAVGSMEAGELETAHQVDFDRIGDDSRAEVTVKFADAIERESTALNQPLPSLLNEVFRQDFRREPEPPEPAREDERSEALEEAGGAAEALGPAAGAREAESQAITEPPMWPASFEALTASQVQSQPTVPQPQPVPVQTVVPSQALVPSQVPVPPPMRTLEDAVREMLRPLLVQWLNENMPRILESAIREEIAARGLIPGPDR